MTKHKDAKEFIQKAKAAAQQLEDKTDDHIKEQINDLLDDFGRLFGDRLPVFIPCQLKTKKPIVKYGHLTETPEEFANCCCRRWQHCG